MRKRVIALLLTVTMTVASYMPTIAAETLDEGAAAASTEAVIAKESEAEEAVTVAAESAETTVETTAAAESAETTAAAESAETTAETTSGEVTENDEAAEEAEATEEAAADEAAEEAEATEEAAADEAAEEAETTVETTEEAAADEATEEAAADETEVEAETAEATSEETTNEAAASEVTAAEAVEETGDEQIPDIVIEAESYRPGEDILADELFAAYVDEAFGISNELVEQQKSRKVTAGSKLTGSNLGIYNYIGGQLPLIASGELTSTVFEIPVEDLGLEQIFWTAEELGVEATVVDSSITKDAQNAVLEIAKPNLDLIVDALLADQPYLLYWYDKTTKTNLTYFSITAKKVDGEYQVGIKGSVTLYFPVSTNYEAGDYEVDSSTGETVRTAAQNAADIVAKYSGGQDYVVLAEYKEEICALASYNYDAISGSTEYGNPWQLIWVFDGNEDTNVVCEGYSKAFKYLCDQTEFAGEIGCIMVTGNMNSGGHMWNIVNMDDEQNYLVDVTNCDSESTLGRSLFLTGADGSPEDGYTAHSVTYVYDSDMFDVFDIEDLTLATADYEHDHIWSYVVDQTPTYTEEGVKSLHCTVCDTIQEGSEVSIDKLTVSGIENKTYTGSAQTQAIVVKDGDYTLVEGTDYTISYENNVNAGTAKVILNNTGDDYTGTYEPTFTILAKQVTPTVTLSQTAFSYNGKTQKPSVVVKDGNTQLTTSDYSIEWSGSCINVGTYTATVKLKGNYSGSKTASFKINKAANTITAGNLKKVYSSKKRTYSLGVKTAFGTPTYKSSTKSVTVSKAGKVTIKAKFQGKACITITSPGNSNYTSKTKKIYVIVRPTMTRITALKNTASKKITVAWKRNKVGTGIQIQYSRSKTFKNAKSVWTTKNTIVSKTIGKLTKGKYYYVRIRTYTKVGKVKYYATWSAVKAVKVKK